MPVSGGGLSSGVATAVKSLAPSARVIGVEPELAADAKESLERGELVTWAADQTGRTMADGLRRNSFGPLPFEHLRRFMDEIVTVSRTRSPMPYASSRFERAWWSSRRGRPAWRPSEPAQPRARTVTTSA